MHPTKLKIINIKNTILKEQRNYKSKKKKGVKSVFIYKQMNLVKWFILNDVDESLSCFVLF